MNGMLIIYLASGDEWHANYICHSFYRVMNFLVCPRILIQIILFHIVETQTSELRYEYGVLRCKYFPFFYKSYTVGLMPDSNSCKKNMEYLVSL